MKTTLKLGLAAIVLAGATAAQAADYVITPGGPPQAFNVTGAFADNLTFNLATPARFDYMVSNIPGEVSTVIGGIPFTLTSNISGLASLLRAGTPASPGASFPPNSALASGDYFIHVTGTGTGTSGLGAYGLASAVDPVPEPGSLAMMVGGLGLMGGYVRRRKSQG